MSSEQPAIAPGVDRDLDATPAVTFEHVSFAYDDHVVLRDVSFTVPRGSMRILLGASGAKSVVLKLILGLMKPDSGVITVNGERVDDAPEQELMRLRTDIGMLFQESALFDSLTVAENVGYRPLRRIGRTARRSAGARRKCWASSASATTLTRCRQNSGGQRRRVAIARAMASSHASCSSMTRRQASTRSQPRRSTTRSWLA